MFTILIIGQELEKCERLKYLLQDIRTDLKAYCVTSYTKALNYISHYPYTLIVVGLDILEIDGISLVQKIRCFSDAPLITVSAHPTAEEEIDFLNVCADRYLGVKSIWDEIDAKRFLANVQALLRSFAAATCPSNLISKFGLKVSPQRWKAYINGEDICLTPKQFVLLSSLLKHIGTVVTKEQLCQEIWHIDYDINADEALKYHVMELRKKLSLYNLSNVIETVRGIGYSLNSET